VPLCPPKIPHADRTRTRAVAVGSQSLTAWATARPTEWVKVAVTLYFLIRDVLGSNLSPNTGYSEFFFFLLLSSFLPRPTTTSI
jgi:hypothetical protein